MKNITQFEKCPHCGSDYGFSYIQVQRVSVIVDFSGEQIDVGERVCIAEHKKCYCAECGEYIALYAESEVSNES